MAKTLDKNVKWLIDLAAEINRKRSLIPVTGSRSYLFIGNVVYLIYGECATKETARKAENFNAAELSMLAEDRAHNGLEQKARKYGKG